jgi:hypothetical protein
MGRNRTARRAARHGATSFLHFGVASCEPSICRNPTSCRDRIRAIVPMRWAWWFFSQFFSPLERMASCSQLKSGHGLVWNVTTVTKRRGKKPKIQIMTNIPNILPHRQRPQGHACSFSTFYDLRRSIRLLLILFLIEPLESLQHMKLSLSLVLMKNAPFLNFISWHICRTRRSSHVHSMARRIPISCNIAEQSRTPPLIIFPGGGIYFWWQVRTCSTIEFKPGSFSFPDNISR